MINVQDLRPEAYSASGGEVDTADLVIDVTSRMETRNCENCQLEEIQKAVAEENTLHQEGAMDKAMARQLVEEL